MSEYHVPVLLKESVDGLDIRQGGVYLDLTFGGGGHSGEILKRLDAEGCLLGFDQDEDALANVPEDDRFIFVNHNFRYLRNFMRYYGYEEADAFWRIWGYLLMNSMKPAGDFRSGSKRNWI